MPKFNCNLAILLLFKCSWHTEFRCDKIPFFHPDYEGCIVFILTVLDSKFSRIWRYLDHLLPKVGHYTAQPECVCLLLPEACNLQSQFWLLDISTSPLVITQTMYSTVRANLRGLHKAAAIWSPHTEYQLWKCYPFLCTIPYHQIGNNTFWAELVPTYWVPFTPHASTLCMPEQPMNHSSMRKGVTHMVITAWLQCWWLATQPEQTSLESTRSMARECPPCIYIWFAFIGQRMLQGWLFVVWYMVSEFKHQEM